MLNRIEGTTLMKQANPAHRWSICLSVPTRCHLTHETRVGRSTEATNGAFGAMRKS